MAASHYGFFAQQALGPDGVGWSSKKAFWKRMVAKEKRELGRRTLCQTIEDEVPWHGMSVQRLPKLPPSGPLNRFSRSDFNFFGTGEGGSRRASTHLKDALVSSSTCSERRLGPRALKAIAQSGMDICEGLRVLILGENPSDAPRNGPSHD